VLGEQKQRKRVCGSVASFENADHENHLRSLIAVGYKRQLFFLIELHEAASKQRLPETAGFISHAAKIFLAWMLLSHSSFHSASLSADGAPERGVT
jgi:hypothetical protein